MNKFSLLFKKYRLRAEFNTFASFSDALAEKGYYYDESIFSHWQKGSRIPTNRNLILALLELFVERKSIETVKEANEFLSSVGLGYLTEEEESSLHLSVINDAPFQVPSEIAYFTGREAVIEKILQSIKTEKVFLLYGAPGVGKTALAIRLGHLLRDKFPDGVLWYKVDSSNIMDILLSMAKLYGEDISGIKDVSVRASIVRTLLSRKKILLIFDNVSSKDQLDQLIPNSASCCVILCSQEKLIHIASSSMSLPIPAFRPDDILTLFAKVLDKAYVIKNKSIILNVADKLGNIPLAVNIVATHIKQKNLSLESYIKSLDEESVDLQSFHYEDKNLAKAINISFQELDVQSKNVFISLGVFEGRDFSQEAVSFITKLSFKATEKALEQLLMFSFIEQSLPGRYRMHRLMRTFARKKMQDDVLYLRTAQYYEQLFISAEKNNSYKLLTPEVDNIIYVFKKCYEAGYWDEIITLWNPTEKFLSDTNEIKKLRLLADKIDTSPTINNLQKILTVYLFFLLIFWIALFISGLKVDFWNYLYSLAYTFIPLAGGTVGILRAKSWGLFTTNIGKAIFFTSAGLFFWGIGNTIWAYYNFSENVAVPYPSLAELGFLPGYCFWVISGIFLSKATGASFISNQKKYKFSLLIPFLIILLSYYFLIVFIKRPFDTNSPVKIFFDVAYPTLDIITLTLSLIIFGLSMNFFGGKYRLSLYSILFGFSLLYVADFMFSYTTSFNTFFNGSLPDLFFTLALFLLSWGTLSFYITPQKNKK